VMVHEAECVVNTEQIVATLTVRIFQFTTLQVVINLYTEFAMNIGWWEVKLSYYTLIIKFQFCLRIVGFSYRNCKSERKPRGTHLPPSS